MTSSTLTIAVHERFRAELHAALPAGHTLRSFGAESDAAMAALLSDADVLVWGAYKAAWRDPRGCRLRLVHSPGAGVDGIDFAGLPPACTVCNVYGHEYGVAEQAFLLMLALGRDLFGLDAALRRGDWTPQRPYLPELRGRSLLVLGLGHIGRQLVRWGQFVGMNVRVLTRTPEKSRGEAPGVPVHGLDQLHAALPEADFVVVAIPAVTNTLGLLSAREFQRMKPTAFVVNVGRGPVIDEDALYEALRTRTIAGAGLDVWYQYPAPGQNLLPSRRPFHELSNVIMTPHKPTVETMAYRWGAIAENIRRLAAGEPLERIVPAP
ncbi:MAG: hydroxyacid dehydrogenase [Verrucomicrobia bacterium]|nr:hydroxyacid dehydrogenase [Verrucomicrobiota bacterium]